MAQSCNVDSNTLARHGLKELYIKNWAQELLEHLVSHKYPPWFHNMCFFFFIKDNCEAWQFVNLFI